MDRKFKEEGSLASAEKARYDQVRHVRVLPRRHEHQLHGGEPVLLDLRLHLVPLLPVQIAGQQHAEVGKGIIHRLYAGGADGPPAVQAEDHVLAQNEHRDNVDVPGQMVQRRQVHTLQELHLSSGGRQGQKAGGERDERNDQDVPVHDLALHAHQSSKVEQRDNRALLDELLHAIPEDLWRAFESSDNDHQPVGGYLVVFN
mmetsp:Transcript_46718/g.144678  ORF Transcript_46718/g.144678 Transcript_46718/m.144678 type:complete len:201 (+) Transcript_46718:634-1236(+)